MIYELLVTVVEKRTEHRFIEAESEGEAWRKVERVDPLLTSHSHVYLTTVEADEILLSYSNEQFEKTFDIHENRKRVR